MKWLYFLLGLLCVFYGCFVMAFAPRGVSFAAIFVLTFGVLLKFG